MYNSRNSHFWIIFIVTLFIFSYTAYFLAERFYLWSSYIGIIAGGLLFFLVIIPFTVYLADMLMKFTIDKNLYNKSVFKFLLAFMVILPIALVSITVYNEYREKNLTTVLSYEPVHVESLDFRLDGSETWETNNDEAADELFHFLSQYHVKKMSDSEWDSDVSEVTSFEFTVYSKGDIIAASVHENRLILYSGNGGYYSVTNGPVNLEWVADYNEKYD
ncbi:hypothetical protein [Lentibacillus sediminis]|uniref:hypothetical protein n=1 Tax=Lentibacillus sediminis TaxID=1940529 RepID=UPI000C1BBF0B|nr:hypothetical protein [Lentibacillus sediminis]